MVSNELLESKLEGLADAPTATDLEYEDSELYTVLNSQTGLVEFKPEKSPESDGAWLRINTESFVFNLEECH